MKITKVINICVSGATSTGKSHVMTVIEKALKAEYGIHTQVCSYDLSVDRNGNNDADMIMPQQADAIFYLEEFNTRKLQGIKK
jgi:uridine kinase